MYLSEDVEVFFPTNIDPPMSKRYSQSRFMPRVAAKWRRVGSLQVFEASTGLERRTPELFGLSQLKKKIESTLRKSRRFATHEAYLTPKAIIPGRWVGGVAECH